MSKTFDIYFDDLTEDAQARILKYKGVEHPAEAFWNIAPIATLVETDVKEEEVQNLDDHDEVWQEGIPLDEEDSEEGIY